MLGSRGPADFAHDGLDPLRRLGRALIAGQVDGIKNNIGGDALDAVAALAASQLAQRFGLGVGAFGGAHRQLAQMRDEGLAHGRVAS